MSSSPPEPLWTLKDLAAFLNVTEGSARKIIGRGQLPAEAVVRVGARIRIRAAIVVEWIKTHGGAHGTK